MSYIPGVKLKIDSAGRLLIPSKVRRRLGLVPGCEVELVADEAGLRLQRRASPPALVRLRGRLLAVPAAPIATRPRVDPAAWIEQERRRGC